MGKQGASQLRREGASLRETLNSLEKYSMQMKEVGRVSSSKRFETPRLDTFVSDELAVFILSSFCSKCRLIVTLSIPQASRPIWQFEPRCGGPRIAFPAHLIAKIYYMMLINRSGELSCVSLRFPLLASGQRACFSTWEPAQCIRQAPSS